MGTSLSGLTPATTFDGLLKVGDNEPLDGTLKAISTGEGTDTILQLSNSALQIGGATTIVGEGTTSATAALLIQNSNGETLLKANDSRDLYLGSSTSHYIHQGQFFQGNYSATGSWNFGTASDLGARLGIKGSGATSGTTSLLVQNSDGNDSLKITDDNGLIIGNSTTNTTHNINSASSSPLTVSRLGVVRFSVSSDSGNGQIVLKGNTNNEFAVGTNGNNFQINDGVNTSQGTKRFSILQDGSTGIGDVTPTARLHVKGSGATSATTSLLVQNSAGTDMLKVADDGLIQMRQLKIDASTTSPLLYAENNSGKSLRLGNQAHLSAYNIIDFKTWDGSAYSEAMRITGANDQFVGIGETTPTARLQVKGSGNDATTTALLVQNSDGDDMLKVGDDSILNLSGTLTIQRSAANFGIRIGNESRVNGFIDAAATNVLYLASASSGGNNIRITPTGIGVNAVTPTAKLHVKGSGATSATTALLVQNSAGTDMLKVRDDGSVINNGGGSLASNTAFGGDALTANTTAIRNTAIGNEALSLNTTFGENTAVGYQSLKASLGGVGNTAIGSQSLAQAQYAGYNVAVGTDSLRTNTTGDGNTAIGTATNSGNFDGSIMLGRSATATADNQFVVGSTVTEAGTVTAEAGNATHTWTVKINGVDYKILMEQV